MPRILGGENAVVLPFQFFLASSSPTRHDFGSATLISERHAITSGKLIAGFQKWILAYGSTKLGPQSKKLESRIAFLHPAYDITTNENDLGIILLPALPSIGGLRFFLNFKNPFFNFFPCSQSKTDCIAFDQRKCPTIERGRYRFCIWHRRGFDETSSK